MDSDDVALPRATIQKYVKESCVGHRVSLETMDLMMDCAVEFVQLIASEANEVSGQESKSTINPQHVIKSIERLGYTGYVPLLQEALKDYKETIKALPKLGAKNMDDKLQMTEEEQIELQKKMFEEARRQSSMQIPTPQLPQQSSPPPDQH